MGLEELVVFVPEFGVDLFLQVVGFGEIRLSFGGKTAKHADVADGHRIAVHVGIDRGAQVLLLAPSTDGFLHCVLHIGLPIEATFTSVRCLPIVILPFQRTQSLRPSTK